MSGVQLDLHPVGRGTVLDILAAHLLPGAEVWVFGSRATGRARRFSDLDLAGRRLTLDETAALAEAFSESDLPFLVDIADWRAIGDGFRTAIAGQRVLRSEAPGGVGDIAMPRS